VAALPSIDDADPQKAQVFAPDSSVPREACDTKESGVHREQHEVSSRG
jgi:hypothetical protein